MTTSVGGAIAIANCDAAELTVHTYFVCICWPNHYGRRDGIAKSFRKSN